MGHISVRQPNKKWAVYSSVVDDFLSFNNDCRESNLTMGWAEAVKSAISTYYEVPDTVREAVLLGLVSQEKVDKYLAKILRDMESVDDDYYQEETEDGEVYSYVSEPVQPFYISDKAKSVLSFEGKNFDKIFSNCSIYIYGYAYGDVTERTLSKNVSAGGHPFNDVILTASHSGTAERFEIVANEDPFIFFGGGIGDRFGAPMIMNTLSLSEGTLTNI